MTLFPGSVPKKGIAELYKAVVKDIFYQQTGSQADGKKELLNQIQTENDRLAKARRLLLDDDIDSNDYKTIKAECESKLLSLEAKLTGFGKTAFDLDDCLDKALTNLSRLQITYNEGDAVVKRRIIGSMYPEKLCFDGGTYRTARMNEAARLIYLIKDQSEKLGDRYLRIDISEPEKKESSISHAPGSSPESFDFSVERFGRGIGASVIKEVQDRFIMRFY